MHRLLRLSASAGVAARTSRSALAAYTHTTQITHATHKSIHTSQHATFHTNHTHHSAVSSSTGGATPSDSDLVQWQNFNSAGLRYLSEGSHEKASLLFMSAMREPIVLNTVYQYLSLSNLGISFRHLGRYEESRGVLLQALHSLKGYSQIHDGMIANLYREAALACESMEKLDEAESLLTHSLHYYSQHSLAKEHASSKSAPAATSAADQAKLLLETAATHYTLALLIHKTATAAAATVASTGAKGKNLNVHLRLRDAERHYKDALKMMRIVYGTDVTSKSTLLTAPVLASMGTMYNELADTNSALSHWMEALTIYQQHQDPRLLPILDAYMATLQKQDPAYAQLLTQQEQQQSNDTNSQPESKKE